MNAIKLNRNPDQAVLQSLGVSDWPIWIKQVSKFPWT